MLRAPIISALLALTLALTAYAADNSTPPASPTSQPAAAYVISDMRIQTMAPMTFLFVSQRTTRGQMLSTVGPAIAQTVDAVQQGTAQQTGPAMLICHDVSTDPAKPFTADAGILVSPGAKPAGKLKVANLEPFTCASVLYSGSLEDIGKAYEKLVTATYAAGYTPTGEMRQFFFYFESPQSNNNVFQLMVGVE